MFFPMLYMLLSGKVGRIRLPDLCVILICIWSSISYVVLHGFAATIETIGILWVETLGAYLVGRCFIRTSDDFFAAIQFIFRVSIFVIPVGIYELQTGQRVLLQVADIFGSTYPPNHQPGRLGLTRVQGPFAHPIHFGVFFGVMVGVAYFVLGYGKKWFSRIWRAGIFIALCFLSLSSGPLIAAITQIYFIVWNGVFNTVKSRWYILAGILSFLYIVIDIISNRSPIAVFVSYAAFQAHTAYARIVQWEYGTQSIWENPIFGIGLSGEWGQLYWMGTSVDMFWILPAMRHGVLVWGLWFTLFFSVFFAIAYRNNLSDKIYFYRLGYLCSMSGLFLSGWAVHFWDVTYVYLLFFIASGIWMLDWKETGEVTASPELSANDKKRELNYTRFPKNRSGANAHNRS